MKNKKTITAILFYILAIFAGHLAESVIYGLALNTIVSELWRDDYRSKAIFMIAVYGILASVAFCVIYTVIGTRSVEYREALKAEIKSKSPMFSVFKKFYLKNLIYEAPVYAAFLIPYTLFFTFEKYVDLSNSFAFEKFYTQETWAYIVSGHAITGFLISVPLFLLILYAVRFIVLLITRKSIIDNSVTLQ